MTKHLEIERKHDADPGFTRILGGLPAAWKRATEIAG
jgi:hypothetical protein